MIAMTSEDVRHLADLIGTLKNASRPPVSNVSHDVRELAELLPPIVWIAKPDGCIEYMNRRWFETTGLSADDPEFQGLGGTWRAAVHPDDFAKIVAEWQRAARDHTTFECVYRLRSPDGYHWHLGRATPLISESGEILNWIGTAIDIHRQIKTEQELSSSNTRLEVAMEGFLETLSIYDREWRLLYANPHFYNYYGLEPASSRGKTLWELFPKADGSKVGEAMRKVMDSGVATKVEIQSVADHGRWLEARIFPSKEGLVIFGSDIHDRKVAEEAMRLERARFEAMIRQLDVGVMILDAPNGDASFINAAAHRVWCTSLKAAPSERAKQIRARFPDGRELKPEEWPGLRALRTGEEVRGQELELIRTDGSSCFVAISSSPIRDGAGKITAALLTLQDITELKSRERASAFLSEAMMHLTSSFDDPHALQKFSELAARRLGDWSGIALLGDDGCLNDVSMAFNDPSLEPAMRALRSEFPPDPALPGGEYEAVRTRRTTYMLDMKLEYLLRTAVSQRHRELLEKLAPRAFISVPIVTKRGAIGVLNFASRERAYSKLDVEIAEEIGKRVGLALENTQLYKQATSANRLKDEFLATLSHELRTPLNVIHGHAQLLMSADDWETLPPLVRESIEAIDRNAKAQTQIIADLLDVSAIMTGKFVFRPAMLDPEEIASAVVDTLRPMATAKDIQLSWETEQAPPKLFADPTRLRQILWNLCSNAIKFTDPGGRVTVRIQSEPDAVVFSVTDTGRGIRPEFLPHVFERFRQEDSSTTRRYGGLGLGLSIVRQLSELHGGSVRVESPGPGLGSTFTVRLPLPTNAMGVPIAERTTVSARAPVAKPERDVRLDGLRVLLVDDSDDGRKLISRVLKGAGAEVCEARSAAEARTQLASLAAGYSPDLLVCDIGMPEEDGLTFIRSLRDSSRWRNLPAIALTAYVRPEERENALAAGFNSHVGKPVDTGKLLEAVETIVRHPS